MEESDWQALLKLYNDFSCSNSYNIIKVKDFKLWKRLKPAQKKKRISSLRKKHGLSADAVELDNEFIVVVNDIMVNVNVNDINTVNQ